jgi:antitoxin component YwqK of YwqJK toxin-antitoxin module
VIEQISYIDGVPHGVGVILEDGVETSGTWVSGKKDGEFIETYMGEQSKGSNKQGVKEGYWVTTFSNGHKKVEAFYTGGEKLMVLITNGMRMGNLKLKRITLFRSLMGKSIRWYENGTLNYEIDYTNGVFNDGTYSYYKENGQLYQMSTYKNGLLRSKYGYNGQDKDGYFVEYYSNGKKKFEGEYDEGKRISIIRYGANKANHGTLNLVKSVLGLALIYGLAYAVSLL